MAVQLDLDTCRVPENNLPRARRGGKDVLGRPAGHVVRPEDRLPIVTEWSGMTDYVNAPPDYGTFFKQYKNYTRSLVLQFGVPPSDLEDIVTDIMVRFFERDSLGVFSREWKTRSDTGRSNFRSYYSRFVVTYARGKNRNVRHHSSHYLLICDAAVDEESSTTGLDMLSSTSSFESDLVNQLDFESLVEQLRTQVGSQLSETLDAVIEVALGTPVFRITELAKTMGVSPSEARNKLAAVRAALSPSC